MSKKDLHFETLSNWDEYKDKNANEVLRSIYSQAEVISKSWCKWYWKSIKSKRIASTIIRFSALFLLIVGTLLPILAGLGHESEAKLLCTQIGVAVLACAGLLQVSDRLFGCSSGWLRYVSTVTAMENLTLKFELDWANYIIGKNGIIDNKDIKPLFDLFKQYEDDISKLRSDETDKWVAEFNTNIAMLNDLIKSQREATEKTEAALLEVQQKADEAKKNHLQKGAIEVTLTYKTEPIFIKIAIDNNPLQEFKGLSWASLELAPGQHTINITTPQGEIAKVVKVLPGDIARIEVSIP